MWGICDTEDTSSEISNKVSGYMMLYAHQFLSYKDMTSIVVYSGKCLLRRKSLLQVRIGFSLTGWLFYIFDTFCFQLCQKTVQTGYGTQVLQIQM